MEFSSGLPNFTWIKLAPQWVTGFICAEGSFIISITKTKNNKWKVSPIFRLSLHTKDLSLLYKVKSFYGEIGNIFISSTRQEAYYSINKLSDLLNVIIPHFKTYPLKSVKSIDFMLWEKCIIIINNKEHLTESGLIKLVSIKSALNLGLTEKLRSSFPEVKGIIRPEYVFKGTLNPYWVSGFTEGDGCFSAHVSKNKNQVRLFYQIILHERETSLIYNLQKFLGGIGIISFFKANTVSYTITKINDLYNIILPHFDNYPLQGNKQINYLIWK